MEFPLHFCLRTVCNRLNPKNFSVRSVSFESIGIKVMKSAILVKLLRSRLCVPDFANKRI